MRQVDNAILAIALAALPAAGAPSIADWPEFRGPRGNGNAPTEADPPVRWSESENVAWKTPIPHRGWSTPAVAEGRAWLTTATPDGREMFAIGVDAETGKILHTLKLFQNEAPEPLGNPVNCYASPSPVAAPGRVFIHFGSYGTACLDAATGAVVWQRRDLPCRHYRGPGSSPVLFGDLLILTMDGVDVQYLVALEAKTGKTAWKTDRTANWNDLDSKGKPSAEGDFRKAYSTPLVAEVGGAPVLFNLGAKAAYAHDPRTGKELWRLDHPGYSGASRPLFDGVRVFFTSGFGRSDLLAVPAAGPVGGRATWTLGKGVPQKPSPVLVGDLLFWVNDGGVAFCVEAASGTVVWQERVGGKFSASPVCAGGRLYVCSEEGKTTVLKAGRAYEVLAENTLEAGCMASPAVVGKALILRTKTHLYRIEGKTVQ
jgi:outer membrane protein assembly factor BamB